MLDLVASECRQLDSTFPGARLRLRNFLAEILRRKLCPTRKPKGGVAGLEQFEHRTLRAPASIYGIAIDPANVAEAARS